MWVWRVHVRSEPCTKQAEMAEAYNSAPRSYPDLTAGEKVSGLYYTVFTRTGVYRRTTCADK